MAEVIVKGVALTREHRDAIWAEIKSIMHLSTDLPLYLENATTRAEDREWIRTIGLMISASARLLDQIGCHEHGDRDTYLLEIDDAIAHFMERLGRNSERGLEDDREALLKRRDDYEVNGYVMSDEEWAEEVAGVRRLVNLDLDGMDAARKALNAYREVAA